jgi:hypothetical protein
MLRPLPRFCAFVVFALLLHAAPSAAQETISSDRPGFGDGSATMQPRAFQVEAGYSYSVADDVTRHSIGEVLFRYGVTERFELRAALNSYQLQRGDAPDEDGISDTDLGLKFNLVRGADVPMGRPNLTLIASTSLPTGDDVFSSGVAQPTLTLAYDWPLGAGAGLSINGGYTFDTAESADDTVSLTASLGAPVPGAADLGVYVGYAGFYTDVLNTNYAEAGFTYLVTPRLQLDLNGGIQLDGYSDEVFIGFGLAQRF